MVKDKRSRSLLLAVVLIGHGISLMAGCSSSHYVLSKSQHVFPPLDVAPTDVLPPTILSTGSHQCDSQFPWPNQGSTTQLSKSFQELARLLSDADDPRSTDYYFQAAVLSWRAITEQSHSNTEQSHSNVVESSAATTYQTSLAGLITEAKRFGRIERGLLRIYQPEGPQDISLVSSGLPIPIDELSDLQIVSSTKHGKLKHYHSSPGLGVPVVAMRTRPRIAAQAAQDPAEVQSRAARLTVEQYIPPCLPVAATVILRPRHDMGKEYQSERGFVVDLVNPLQVGAIRVGCQVQPLARDISAPLEYLIELRPSNPLTGFILPGSETRDEGLKWLEPYKPGKIPVVFVHGLLSDPTTWMDMVNDLRTHDWFNERYQVWGFNYATGNPFVASALGLRVQLREARAIIDPHSQDPALGQMVLIGHSMGGLVAKLQVTESEHRIWDSIARVPLDSIQTSEAVRHNLTQSLYFTSQPFVTRVVYIATPHKGSSLAIRSVGRVSSALVRPDELQRSQHRQLINDNPDAFFGTFRRRIPTSIDLLEPSDCTLQTIFNLQVPERVVQHTILGTGKRSWSWGWSDGVVNLDSARHHDSHSELHVAAAHTEITRDAATISEVTRILREHLVQSVASGP